MSPVGRKAGDPGDHQAGHCLLLWLSAWFASEFQQVHGIIEDLLFPPLQNILIQALGKIK